LVLLEGDFFLSSSWLSWASIPSFSGLSFFSISSVNVADISEGSSVVLWSEPSPSDASDAVDATLETTFMEPDAADTAVDAAVVAAEAAVVAAVVATVADAEAAVLAADFIVDHVPVNSPPIAEFAGWSLLPVEPVGFSCPSEGRDSSPFFDSAPFVFESADPFVVANEATFAARDATFTDADAAVVAAVAAVDAADVAAEAAVVAAVVAAVADADAAVEAADLTVVHVFENKEGTGGRTADQVPDNKLPSLEVDAGPDACPSTLPAMLLVVSSSISSEA
jgi:hypothetical protein